MWPGSLGQSMGSHTLNTKLIKLFKLRSHGSGVKGRVGSILAELEKLWEELVGMEKLFKDG